MKPIYYIEINGKPKGPFTIEELKEIPITKESVVWKEGLPDWVKATEIEEINKLIKIPVEPNKIIPPPLPVNPIDFKQAQRVNRIEIIKLILRLNRKWVLAIILLTVVSYALIAHLEGGFKAIQLYNKYSEIVASPEENARRNQPRDNNENLNQIHDPTPLVGTPVPLSEYRDYIDNPSPYDPRLDFEMIDALKDKIASSFGFTTILAALFIFAVSMLILIVNSKLWKS
jgi:hypothetical protein